MAKTPARMGHGEGGATVSRLTALFDDLADDIDELRTQIIALLAKLDADGGVTDVDYEATLTPAARKHLASDE